MNDMNDIYLTLEQLEKTKKELDYYILEKRPEIVERIKEAKSYGDLSENSEYDSAREEQAFVEAKIKELDTIVTNAKIIEHVENSEIVALGTTAFFTNVDTKEKFCFKIVGVGANPLDEDEPSISTNTPMARALLGCKVDEEFVVDAPNGAKKFILNEIK